MTARDLAARVVRHGALAVAVLAAGLAWFADARVGAGVALGGVVALVNFGWMAREVSRVAAAVADGEPGRARLPRVGLRQLATFAALAALIGPGWAHPVGVAVGLAILPPVLLVEGLRAARATA
jgi:hypothetical protein